MTKRMPAMTATFLSLVSRVFLLPYSLAPDIQPIPNQIPHLGDIKRTDPTKTIPATTIKIISNVRMCCNIKKINNSFNMYTKSPNDYKGKRICL